MNSNYSHPHDSLNKLFEFSQHILKRLSAESNLYRQMLTVLAPLYSQPAADDEGPVLLNPALKITIWLVTGSNAHIVPPRSSEVILRSPPTTPELLCAELVGKECSDHHQKIVYFPAEFSWE